MTGLRVSSSLALPGTITRFLRILSVASVLAAQPSSAFAQLDRFVQAVRELASKSNRAATDDMAAALAEWDRRIAALEERARTIPGAYQSHIELGVALRARGRISDAVRELDAAAALRPSSSDLQVLRALTFESAGRLDEARRAFRAAWMLDAGDPVKAYYVVDRSSASSPEERSRAGAQLLEAYRRLRTASARPATPPFAVLDAVPDTLTRAPLVGDNATAEGFALLAAEKFDGAVNALRRQPPANDASGSPATHFALAKEVEARNRIAEAKREYAAALRGTATGRNAILVEMARLSQIEGNHTEAVESFRRAARLAPNDPLIHRELAGAYIADGRTDDAFLEFVAALLVDPLDAQTFAAIGQLSVDTGRYADAAAAFTRALELKPDAFELRYALATALTRAGNTAEASRQFDMYEQQRREALDRRRRDIADDVDRQERTRSR